MYGKVLSATPIGIEAVVVQVEVQVSSGLPSTRIVGLADAVTRESRERVLGAVRAAGFPCPAQRIVVNLAPADVRKVGSSLDLPIALSLLVASGCAERRRPEDVVVVGELSLGGEVAPVQGVLVMADAARRAGIPRILVPRGNAAEAALVDGLEVLAVSRLEEAVGWLAGNDGALAPWSDAGGRRPAPACEALDLADVQGQLLARRALEIAAAGGHNVLMVGPPGSGKTMLAQRLPGLLPPLGFEEAIEVTKIHSVAGMLGAGNGIVRERPFRSPHHTVSPAGLVGGGPRLRPGDVSLAHRGVLFLDELSEFPRHVLELLRQPLEDRRVYLSRAARGVVYPASFILVAAMNPCPCGYRGSRDRSCACPPSALRRHWQRLSGPLMDRIDMVLEVPAVPVREIARGRGGEPTEVVSARVAEARGRQAVRLDGSAVRVNAEMSPNELRRWLCLEADGLAPLARAAERRGLSARAFHRVLKVARTIADLDGAAGVGPRHAAEAMAFRVPEAELAGAGVPGSAVAS